MKHCVRSQLIIYFIVISMILAAPMNIFAEDKTMFSGIDVEDETMIYENDDENEISFSDVHVNDWYYPFIYEMASLGFAKGNTDGMYMPDRTVAADEFLTFALRVAGYDLPNGDTYWAAYYIQSALMLGLVVPGEYDNYDVPITREKIAEIVVRLLGIKRLSSGKNSDLFSDINESPKKEYILTANRLGIVAGYNDGTFRPDHTATRAEAAVIVLRMIDDKYKITMFGDIAFCPVIDLNENKVMKRDKAEKFILEAMKTTQIRIAQNGKAVISGTIPALPKGQYFLCDFSFFDKNSVYLSFRSTASANPKEYIAWPGRYEIVTEADVSKVGEIIICMSITYGKDVLNLAAEPTIGITMYKNYTDTEKPIGVIAQIIGVGQIEYDSEMTRGVWGW